MPLRLNEAFPDVARLLPVRSLPKIRLDLAQRSQAMLAASVGNFAAIQLYNNTNQQHNLVVRGLAWGPAASAPVMLQYQTGHYSGAAGNPVIPVIPDRSLLPGTLYVNYNGSAITGDTLLYAQSLEQAFSGEYPAFVLPPNWSLSVVANTSNVQLGVTFLWEALDPDQFVEMYGAYA